MAGKSRLPKLTLNDGQMSKLQQLSQSRTAPLREVQRARILCHYHAGETIAGIARALKMTRKSVRKWIDKALAMGAEAALQDGYHRPRAVVHTEAAPAGTPRRPTTTAAVDESPASRPSPTQRRTCRRCQENIRAWPAIMNTDGLEPVPFWRRWICTRAMSRPALSAGIAA